MFNIGDVVTLNSGGPDMTVVDNKTMAPNGSIRCMWFNHEGNSAKTEYSFFPPESLKKIKEYA